MSYWFGLFETTGEDEDKLVDITDECWNIDQAEKFFEEKWDINKLPNHNYFADNISDFEAEEFQDQHGGYDDDDFETFNDDDFEPFKDGYDSDGDETSEEMKNAGYSELEEDLDLDEDYLEETYSDEELDSFVGKTYNQRKILEINRKELYGAPRLIASTTCTKCGRKKDVFLSNLLKDPNKYGSCVCSEKRLNAKIAYNKELYSGQRKLASNTSGYTGVSFVSTYAGEPYNKWRAYIEVDGKRTYLGDFDKKKDAVAARKEAGEKGIKWYKENRTNIMKNTRKKTKKYKNSKYKDKQRKTQNINIKDEK